MLNKIQKIKNLSRKELKQINGGGPKVNCNILCGEGSGIVSSTPGVGDMYSRSISLLCLQISRK